MMIPCCRQVLRLSLGLLAVGVLFLSTWEEHQKAVVVAVTLAVAVKVAEAYNHWHQMVQLRAVAAVAHNHWHMQLRPVAAMALNHWHHQLRAVILMSQAVPSGNT